MNTMAPRTRADYKRKLKGNGHMQDEGTNYDVLLKNTSI